MGFEGIKEFKIPLGAPEKPESTGAQESFNLAIDSLEDGSPLQELALTMDSQQIKDFDQLLNMNGKNMAAAFRHLDDESATSKALESWLESDKANKTKNGKELIDTLL